MSDLDSFDHESFDENAECQINDNWSELPDPDYSNKFEGTPLDPYVKKTIVGNFKLAWTFGKGLFRFLKEATGGQVVLTYENGTEDFVDEHFHFLVWDSKIKPDTLKAYIRKAYPILVGDGKGGDKKYQAKFAKELIQLLYIFKERKKYDTNIDFLMDNKNQNMNYYASQYIQMKQTFSKSPAGRFYEWLCKNKTTWVTDKEWSKWVEYSCQCFQLRIELVKHVTEYAKETDNPNPGVAYCQKLINYCHLHLDEENYIKYLEAKIEKDAY